MAVDHNGAGARAARQDKAGFPSGLPRRYAKERERGVQKPIVVIADKEGSSAEIFADPTEKELIRFGCFHDRAEAQLFIAERKNFISGVVIDSESFPPYGIPLIKFSKSHRPATPIYVMLREQEKEPEPDALKGLHIAGLLRKPLDRQDVISKIFPYSYFEMERALEVAKADPAPVNASVSAEDKDMHPIQAKDFLCGSKSFFDVYVRIGSGRFVKLLKAGDAFDADRVKDYIAKGVTHFFVKSDAQEIFLQYCDSMTGILLHKQAVPIDLKVSQVMNYGKETVDFLKARGFNEATLMTAKQFVTHSSKLVNQLKPEESPVLRRFLGNVVLCEHGTGITMLTGLMLEALEFKDEKVRNTLALASFMHDIGLLDMPPHFADEDETKLTPEEMKLYITHPIVGFEMSRSIRMISPIVPSTILEHHERRTGQGFPYARGAGGITQVAEVIGIVDIFVQLLKRAAKDPSIDIVKHMQKNVYNEFSYPVMDAFDKTFLKPITGR